MLKESGRSFVTIMIVVALSALLLRVGIEKLIKYSVSQNELSASGTLKSISVALENFARDNKSYPLNFSELTQGKPSYLDRNYIKISPVRGYMYSCSKLDASGYICNAIPSKCKLTGETSYTISTGSLFFSEDCDKNN